MLDMVHMVLQYTLYGLGIGMTVSATVLGIIYWHILSGALQKMREAQAEGRHVSWYTFSPTLLSIGGFLFSPAFLLCAIATFLSPAGGAWVILRVVLGVIALAFVGTGLFFAVRGRRLSQATSM
jgi:uncharacterized membrane protein